MCGDFNETSYLAASSIELLHTASLVHDDVTNRMNAAEIFRLMRFGKIRSRFLLGDFILARGMLNTLDHKEYRFLHLISRAVKDMSER